MILLNIFSNEEVLIGIGVDGEGGEVEKSQECTEEG
jgi:hypothetical protein